MKKLKTNKKILIIGLFVCLAIFVVGFTSIPNKIALFLDSALGVLRENQNQFILVKRNSNLVNIANKIAAEKNYGILEVSGGVEEMRNQIVEFVSTSKNKYEFMVIFGDSDQIPAYNKENLKNLLNSQGVTPNDPTIANNPLDSIYYGNIDNDPLIELAVGRIPFSNEKDIEDYYNNFIGTKNINIINIVRLLGDPAPMDIPSIKLQFINYNVNSYKESNPLSKNEINSSLTSSDLFQYHTHGSNVSFTIGGGYSYISADIPDLTNNKPIILGGACYNANGIGKDFIKKGALAYIGFVVPGPNSNVKPFLSPNSDDTIGSSMTKTINDDIVRTIISGGNTAYFSPIYVLYADPSLKVKVSPIDSNWETGVSFNNKQIIINFPQAKSFYAYLDEERRIYLSVDEIMHTVPENIFNNIKNGDYYDDSRDLAVKCDSSINDASSCKNWVQEGHPNIPFAYSIIYATSVDGRKFFVRNLNKISGLNVDSTTMAYIEIDGNSISLSNEARYGIMEKGDEKYLFFGEATRDNFNIVKNNGWEKGRKIILEYSKGLTCIDPDDGKKYYIKATTTRGSESRADICISETVKEYYCEQSQIKSIIYTCPNGCKDGACIAVEKP